MHNAPVLDWSMLEDVVHRAGRPAADIVDWSIHKLAGGHETVSDVYRVNIHLQQRDGSTSQFSLILKVIRATPERRSASHWNYWRREAELYQSGHLSALPAGMSAPQCYAVVEQADAVWLWLQDLSHLQRDTWTASEIGRAAFELGRMNAAYLSSVEPPRLPSIHRHWLRHYVEMFALFIEQLPDLQSHPLVGRVVTPELLPRFLELTARREHMLNQLDALPQVFCHMDVWRGNLFFTDQAPLEKQMVLIDWSFACLGPIGQELAPLIFTNRRTPGTYELICQSYAAGLNAAGLHIEAARIQQTSAIAASLIYGVAQVGLFIRNLLDAREHAALESFGGPVAHIPPRAMAWIEFGLHYGIV